MLDLENDPYQHAIHAPWRLEARPAEQWFAERPALYSPELSLANSSIYFDGTAFCKTPSHSGVYFLLDAEAALLYIGKATQVNHRLWRHFLEGRIPFVRAQWVKCPIDGAELLEAYLIGELNPPYNRKFDGGMKSMHADLLSAIRNTASELT